MESTIKKVAIIGPECTGKSDLSQYLAKYFKTVWVPEYARTFIEQLDRPYNEKDLLTIASGQLKSEDELAMKANEVLICDTNLYVIKVWSDFKYKHTDQVILDLIERRHYDLYLLTYIDIPWHADPQREHPHKRQELYDIYLNEMQHQSVPFVEIKGNKEQRRRLSVEAITKILKETIH